LNVEEGNLQNAEFALCLDSFAEAIDNTLNMHVSKPIAKSSENTKTAAVSKFYEILEKKAQIYGKSLESVHKKISLKDASHKWPHEVFSLKRMSAFTLSSLTTDSDPLRNSIFSEHSSSSPTLQSDELNYAMLENIQTNTKILAEALATFVFNLSGDDESGEIFTGTMSVTVKSIKPYLVPKPMSSSNNIKMTFDKFLKNVKMYQDKPDARDPEFMFYDGEEAKLNIYK
jgi:hypothetical protein